jgi:hypothetical protein
LASVVTRDRVDEAVAACGVGALRRGGKLPPHVVLYFVMGLCLFRDDDYEEVAAKVTGSLSSWGCWDARWSPPTSGGCVQARRRVGAAAARMVFESVAVPVASVLTRGAWFRGRRLMAVDGFDVDVPDTAANAEEFGRGGNGEHRSAFPKARVVALSECGTHAFTAAQVCPWSTSEKTAARALYPRLSADQLLIADRGFYSWQGFNAAAATGAALLWRAPAQLRLEPLGAPLPDGSWHSLLINPAVRGTAARASLHAAAAAGGRVDPERARLVRVVEYHADGGEPITVITTLTDPADASAEELAALYHQRWEHETANDQAKTHLRGPAAVLRSRSPELVYQEIWAWLTVHYALAALMTRAAEAADIDPDRISYTRTLRIARRTATGTATFPPSPLD